MHPSILKEHSLGLARILVDWTAVMRSHSGRDLFARTLPPPHGRMLEQLPAVSLQPSSVEPCALSALVVSEQLRCRDRAHLVIKVAAVEDDDSFLRHLAGWECQGCLPAGERCGPQHGHFRLLR